MLDNLLAARSQMALSLGFHIIFASISIAMPFFMAVSHYRWLKTGHELSLHLTKAWSKGVAIFFATGAVSGTILSFELGLLWPEFMRHAGPIIGMPFSWEGTIFFLEAIALGLYLYGWDKMNRWVHWCTGVVVGICGVLSSLFVICVNGWMNSPTGFTWNNGNPTDIDPVAAMFNEAALLQGLHMVVAAFQASGFAVAGVHAWKLRRDPINLFHREAINIALVFAAVASLIQPIIGDRAAKDVARRQPEKFAALESLFVTQKSAPLLIGGIPNEETEKVSYGVHIPGMLSFLATNTFTAEIKGLDAFPKDQRPPVLVTHLAFQVMVGIGSFLALIGLATLYGMKFRKNFINSNNFLLLIALCTPLGFIAIEAGWIVTEVGRQPWIIYRVMRTADAVTTMPGILISCGMFALLYLILAVTVFQLMQRQINDMSKRDICYRSGYR
jgi:cytochrome bd ubiquinol oxidase subunit I